MWRSMLGLYKILTPEQLMLPWAERIGPQGERGRKGRRKCRKTKEGGDELILKIKYPNQTNQN